MKRRNDQVVKQSDRTPRPRRILVLGSGVHTRLVTAYEWDRLPSNLNVSDVDTVIMNFTPFADREFAQGINIDTIPGWQQFARHIFGKNSEIVVIGSPGFSLGSNPYQSSTWRPTASITRAAGVKDSFAGKTRQKYTSLR